MNKTYQIGKLERKTTSGGKAYAVINIDNDGTEVKASIWSDFPDFANLAPGRSITGILYQNDKGYWNIKPPAPVRPSPQNNMLQKKAENIEKAQENKEHGIKTSSTIRMAVDIAIAESRTSNRPMKEMIQLWRAWLWENWDYIPESAKPVSPVEQINADDIPF